MLHVKDVFDVIRHSARFFFADDNKIVYASRSEARESTISSISQDLESINSWADNWMMKFSIEKSSIMGYKA